MRLIRKRDNVKLFFFDLDGPLLDVSDKYYRVYADILQERGYTPVAKSIYWRAKQLKISDREILAQSGASDIVVRYQAERNSRIETDRYLALDRLQEGTITTLQSLSAHYRLVLVTLRSSPTQLDSQLKKTGLAPFFEAILTTGGHGIFPRWLVKQRLIVERFAEDLSGGWFIGDTETDILAGNDLGLSTIAVLSGIRTRELLSICRPQWTIASIRALHTVVPEIRIKPSKIT